jgi:hypothetical protein
MALFLIRRPFQAANRIPWPCLWQGGSGILGRGFRMRCERQSGVLPQFWCRVVLSPLPNYGTGIFRSAHVAAQSPGSIPCEISHSRTVAATVASSSRAAVAMSPASQRMSRSDSDRVTDYKQHIGFVSNRDDYLFSRHHVDVGYHIFKGACQCRPCHLSVCFPSLKRVQKGFDENWIRCSHGKVPPFTVCV